MHHDLNMAAAPHPCKVASETGRKRGGFLFEVLPFPVCTEKITQSLRPRSLPLAQSPHEYCLGCSALSQPTQGASHYNHLHLQADLVDPLRRLRELS